MESYFWKKITTTYGVRTYDFSKSRDTLLAGKIKDDVPVADIIDLAFHSWFARSKSTKSMAEGTKNEDAVMEALKGEQFVEDLFQIGLVEMITYPYLAASPDGVAVIKRNGRSEYASVEIKTRVSFDRQTDAIENERKYGHIAHCEFDDRIFSACVPKEHRTQLLHQASVLQMSVCLYVVATCGNDVNNALGRIVQILIVSVSVQQRDQHINKLIRIVGPLFEFMYQPEALKNRFILLRDVPHIFTNDQGHAMVSRSRLFFSAIR